MRHSILWTISLFCICLVYSSCRDEVYDCGCKDSEVCIYDECYLNEWVHNLGGTTIIARNSYVGIINDNDCIDTLVFYNDTIRAINDERFGLVVAADPFPGTQNVLGSQAPYQVSENEFYASTVAPLCYLNGDSWYANLHYIIYPDSVWMKLRFWPLGSSQGVFIDSCNVTFYKKK